MVNGQMVVGSGRENGIVAMREPSVYLAGQVLG